MSEKVVYITRRNTVGQQEPPIAYPADKYEKRKNAINADGWRLATKEEIERYNDVQEVAPPPKKKPVRKPTKKTEEK